MKINKFKHILPLGVDSAGQVYWKFQYIPGVVVERKKNSEENCQ